MLTCDASVLLAQVHGRRDVIADDWYRAIAPTACAPLDVAQVRQRVSDLTEKIITLLPESYLTRAITQYCYQFVMSPSLL